MGGRFLFFALLVALCCAYQALATAKAEYAGDHYDGAVASGGTTAYKDSVWNYDYSHKLVDGVCKDKSGSTVTCSTTTKCGPACWSIAPDVGGKTNVCSGKNQTPINLKAADIDPKLSPPDFVVENGGCDNWVQFGDDHAFEVSFSEKDKECTNLKLKYGGTTYTLLQFHFHAPAEHAVAGGLGAAELHMVHKSDDGKLLVLGVIMAVSGIPSGGGNQFLRNFWDVAYDGIEEIGQSVTGCASRTDFTGTTDTSADPKKKKITSASTMPSIGDTLIDISGSYCFNSGSTVVSTTGSTITMSQEAIRSCSGPNNFAFITGANLVKKTCNPDYSVFAREAQISARVGFGVMNDQCKYALEFEASGQTPINPYVDFLPADKTFYTYSGSLTTYPCTEGVTWIVYEQPMMVSDVDVRRIMASSACEAHTITMSQEVKSQSYAWADNRPLQPLGSRTLTKYVPSVAPPKPAESPVSIAAIVIGCVGLLTAGGAIGFVFTKSAASKVYIDSKSDDKAPPQNP